MPVGNNGGFGARTGMMSFMILGLLVLATLVLFIVNFRVLFPAYGGTTLAADWHHAVVSQILQRQFDERQHQTTTTTSQQVVDVLDDRPEIVIAHCVFPQYIRPGEPVLGAEYLAKTLGPLAFPDRKIKLITCLAVPEQLPNGVDPASENGLRQLGLLDVHLRFCAYGSSSLLKATLAKLASRRRNILSLHRVVPRAHSASVENLRLPAAGSITLYVTGDTKEVVGPLITRANRESWYESVPGVAVQFDTKLRLSASDSFTVFMPYAYESFGRSRWNGGDPSRRIEHHQESFGKNDMYSLRESVTRSKGFNAQKERESKKYFMAMVNSNCRPYIMRTTMIRGLFGYAVHELLNKPVHNLGRCPAGDNGALRAGITVAQRQAFNRLWPAGKGGRISAQEIFSHHKFSICFENTNVDGYMTEKMVSPYNARSIPIYWGGGDKLSKVFNPRAFIHCDIPANVSGMLTDIEFPNLAHRVCVIGQKLNDVAGDECYRAVENEMYNLLLPFFKPCIEKVRELDEDDAAYDRMLAEPLATVDPQSGELTGYWNETQYALALRAAFDALGYETGPARLKKLLSSFSG